MAEFFDGPPVAITTAYGALNTRIIVRGELDLAAADQLNQALVAAEESDLPILLDMSGVTFIDSSGLKVVVEHVLTAWQDGDRLRIRPSEEVTSLFALAGLTERFARLMQDAEPDVAADGDAA
jgi:anti-anti-sigma factor